MKINGGKARKRKAEYWLMLSFTWNPSFIVDFKQESRVNDNRKSARMKSAEPRTCENCFFKEIFWHYGDMLRDIENTCFRCSKQQWCTQTHLKTGRTIEILPNITKRNMWKHFK